MRVRWANIPLPEANIIGLVLGSILRIIFHVPIFEAWLVRLSIGSPALLFGVALCTWSVIAANLIDIESPDRLLTSGPYSFSRNPMYVGWMLIHLGIAILLNSVWLLVSLVIAFVYIHFFEIPAEERELGEKFGEDYRLYSDQVRRYF
jgi:protein-S-isoprenylcysteine O-methyltransferase Ste14